jgi:hypothetical protein
MATILTGKIDGVDRKETLRYLGYYNHPSPERTEEGALLNEMKGLFDECESNILSAQNLTACYDIYDIVLGQPLNLGFATVNSLALERNLQGCKKIVLFAATAGVGVDRLIVKYNKLSPARAVVYQAMGAALIEQWCDIIHGNFQKNLGANKSRFSCGYGDLPLTLQRDIFTALNVTKNLGITLSDNCFMTPTKSVTAIIGIKS